MSETPQTPEGWERSADALHRTFSTRDFAEALALVNRIGELAEKANHHPDLELGWGRVVVHLSSHDVGAITERDVALAQQIDKIAG
ncbi:MAG TPA: 4a-hydroxytetrahydrobiopterin dehydratase [Marmoricola sp.]